MNKLLIGLLIVAAGAGTFLLLRKKKNNDVNNPIHKEWVIGKWKTDAAPGNHPGFSRYSYDFLKTGKIVRSLTDSAKADTLQYEWGRNNELVWKENATDSTGMYYTILKLTADSLLMQSKDSTTIIFTKQTRNSPVK